MAKIARNKNELETIESKAVNFKNVWGPYYYVQDLDRAISFYTHILGMTLHQRFGNDWAEVKLGSHVIGLQPGIGKKSLKETMPARGPGEGATVSLVVNKDIERVVDKLKAQGVYFSTDGIVHRPHGKMAEFQDTEGNWLHLIEI